MNMKRYIQQGMLLACVGCIGAYIILGKRGVVEYLKLKKELNTELQEVRAMELKLAQLQTQIKEWETNPLEFEKVAREDLQMAFTNEIMYHFPERKV
jgi:cell division protein FtsB